MWWIIAAVAACVLVILLLMVEALNAPEGYEDEDGFHIVPRTPAEDWRAWVERSWPNAEIDDEAYQRAVDYCEQPVQFHQRVWPGEYQTPQSDGNGGYYTDIPVEWGTGAERNPITGQSMTPQERFDSECG